ncbi:hypothetical protein Tco_0003531 [Tanacetum coccineum]
MYDIMEDAQDDRSLLRARVNQLYRDRPVYRRLAVLIEREARMAHEAWGLSMDASEDVMSLHTTVVAQSALISELQSADHRRQGTQMAEFQSYAMQPVIIYLVQHTKCYGYIPASMALENGTKEKDHEVKPKCNTDTVTQAFLSTNSVTNAQIQAMINEGVTAALAARDATRNGDDSHTSGTGARRPVQVARECTYLDFLKCQPLNFKGTEGVVGLTQELLLLGGTPMLRHTHEAAQWNAGDMKKMMTGQIMPKAAK